MRLALLAVNERFVSAVEQRKDYTYHMYTALQHTYKDNMESPKTILADGSRLIKL